MPIFGICLGHQILGLALGGKTYKLKFGHHGGNQPVMDLTTGKVEITARTTASPSTSTRSAARPQLTHVNLNDQTVEGLTPQGAAAVLRAVPPRGVARPARRELSLPPLRRPDGIATAEPMPKRTDIHTILLIGSGPIVIGQACEFDYSGTQACKALKEEGYRVVLVNSNPATIMTDPEFADRTYVEPITADDPRARSSSASGPTRCCRRSAARPASTSPSSSPSAACSSATASS